jgi:hypothetical protein
MTGGKQAKHKANSKPPLHSKIQCMDHRILTSRSPGDASPKLPGGGGGDDFTVTAKQRRAATWTPDVDLKLIGEEGYGAGKLPADHLR